MRRLRALWIRFGNMLDRGRSEGELSAELEAHVALHTEAGVAAGMSEAEARRIALVKLGGAEQVLQAQRERARLVWMENLVQDVRYGARTLRRAPGFALTAIATVGLGIGACTAIFSLVNAVLIRSLPYGDPERLVYLFSPNPNLKIPAEVICPAYGDFYDLKRESRSFESMSNFVQVMSNLNEGGTVQQVGSARVDEDFFRTLEANPEIGRAITSEDVQSGRDKVIVISHSMWMSRFGGRSDVLQQSIVLDKATYRVIGVMPPEFEYPFGSDLPYGNSHIKSTQVWMPLVLSAKQRVAREPDDNTTIARLRSGVSVRAAQAEMAGIMARLDKEYPGNPNDELGPLRQWGALIERLTDVSIGPVRPLMRLLLAAVGLVLLIACGNAANLLLARAAERARELGVRTALGAGRGRMVRQLLTESLLIGAAGCAVGVALAFLFLRLLPKLDPGNIPRLNEASLDWRVLAVALGAALFTSLFAGLLPAWRASRVELTEFLKAHGARASSRGHSRVQSGLIVSQTAMVVVLLAAAGLLIRSYVKVVNVDTGFSQATVTFHVSLDDRYKTPEQQVDFFRQLTAKLNHLPGVVAAGAVNYLPLTNSESITLMWIDGSQSNKEFQEAEARYVTPQYFTAMGISLIAGRYLTEDDITRKAGVTVINKRLADVYFPNRNPIGARISTNREADGWKDFNTVVGVVGDVRHVGLEEEAEPQMYYANYQMSGAGVAVRSALPVATLTNEIRLLLKQIDPQLAMTDIRTMGEWVSLASARRRFQTSLLTAFAGIALVLALVGLYGLMAFSVNRRTREVGIRMALGAERRDVLLLVMRNAGALVGAGLVAGLACVWMMTRVMRSFLFGVSEHDPMTVVAVSALMVVCGLVAAVVPAKRAASIEPMQALRTE
ncbi:ABC transporter permease [Occallatibacter savannae]|uniref:ABC transporter permease n=1 Tax=Occallatibacter savannae TaxID=1002691 RepID=UPI000D69BE87|nr:ABC transporter permease [Occallatibacter savannae]